MRKFAIGLVALAGLAFTVPTSSPAEAAAKIIIKKGDRGHHYGWWRGRHEGWRARGERRP
jgi:hypothetical protein